MERLTREMLVEAYTNYLMDRLWLVKTPEEARHIINYSLRAISNLSIQVLEYEVVNSLDYEKPL